MFVLWVMRIQENNHVGQGFHTTSLFGGNGGGIAQFVHLGDIHAYRSGGSGGYFNRYVHVECTQCGTGESAFGLLDMLCQYVNALISVSYYDRS